MKRFLLSILFFVGFVFAGVGQSVGDFQTRQSGNWNDSNTWEEWTGSSWDNTANTPTSANGVISLLNTHIVTVTANVAVDQTFVRTGGQLNINSGVTLTVAAGSGDDLTSENLSSIFNNGTISIQNVPVPPPPKVGLIRIYGQLTQSSTGVLNGASTSTLFFENGSEYVHNKDGGIIPVASWNANSTVLITGITSGVPSNLSQNFGNFTWNCTAQSAFIDLQGSLQTVNGTLSVLDNAFQGVYLATAVDYTLNVGGDLIVTGGTSYLGFNSGNIANVNIGGDLEFLNGSYIDFSFSGDINLDVSGNVNISNSSINVAYGGSAVVSIFVDQDFLFNNSTVGNLSTSNGLVQFTGVSNQNISGVIDFQNFNYEVLSGSTLYIPDGSALRGASGAANFTLNTGATLLMGSSSISGVLQNSTSSGSVRVSGTKNFNTGSSLGFIGNAIQYFGNAFPSSGVNLVINNTGGGVNMNSDVTISSGRTLSLTNGTLNIGDGNLLTLNGSVSTTNGGISGGSLSSLAIGGTGAFGTLGFVGTPELQNFTLNRTSSGSVTLGGNLTVSGAALATDGFTQTAGDLILNGNTLTLSGNYDQTGGTLISNSTSSLLINGTGTLPGSLSFSGDINTITLDRASATLNTAASGFTATNLNLYSGTLEGTAIGIADGGTLERRTNGSLTNALTPVGNYNLIYDHTTALNTGAELPTSPTALNNIEKRGSGVLTVQNDFTANGSLTFTNGSFNAGANTISLNGDLVANAGSTLTSATITFDGVTNLSGSNTPTFGNITVSSTSTFNPTSSLNVNGNITNDGTLNSTSGTLTINAASTLGGSNPITVNNLTIGASGNVTASSAQALGINGNFANNGTFAANGGTVIFGGNTTISGTVPTFASVQVNGTLNAPASLEINNNFTNNGTFVNNSGQVRFTSGSTRVIDGTATTSFFDLSVEGGTTNVNGTVNLENAMTFAGSPTVDFDGAGTGVFTLKSTQTRDASIANVGTATLQGNLNVERAVYTLRGDGKGYHMIGFPITGATVGEVIASGYAITGFPGAPTTGTQGDGFASVFSYDQSAAGDFSNGYVDFPGASGSTASEFAHGSGYFMFTYAGVNGGTGTITTNGTVFTGSVTKTLPYTANGNVAGEDEGWHLVANPYPSAINWDLLAKTTTEPDAWLWNPNAGAWEALTGGTNATIPQGQAFFIRSLPGGGSITFDEVDKVSTFKSFYRTPEPTQIFKVGLNNGTYVDYTYIGLKEGATYDYNGLDDASRLLNNNETISTMTADGKIVKVNRIPFENEGTCGNSIFINLEQMVNAKNYTLKFEGIQNLSSKSIQLYDHYLDQTLDLSTSDSLQFTVNADAASKGATRFEIIINNKSPKTVAVVTEDICPSENAIINLQQSDDFANYLVYKGADIIASAQGTGAELSIEVLNEFLVDSTNSFEIKAFAAGCDTVNVGNASVQVFESLSVNNAVEGSSICKSETQAMFSVATQINTSYHILNDTDTIQSFEGNGNLYEGLIASTELVDGLNQFTIAASKDGCQSGTLTQALEIVVQNPIIDETIAFNASNSCLKTSSNISFMGQEGVQYEVFKGTTLIKSLTGDGTEKLVEIPAGNLSLGQNEFRVLAKLGECAQLEFAEPIIINVEANINPNLSLVTENICGDNNTTILIENAQAGKIYTLQNTAGNVSSLTATEDGPLTFNLNPNQLNVGLNEFDIQIEGDYCGTVASANKAQIRMFEPINTNLNYQTVSSCNSTDVVVGIQNAQAGKTYYLYKGVTLIETIGATEGDSIVFAAANNALNIGQNEFTVKIEGEGCGIETALQTVDVNLFEDINAALEITSSDVCQGEDVVIGIGNPQANKTYTLKNSAGVITSKLAGSTEALNFIISSDQFTVGSQEISIEISDDNCGTVEANSTSFTLYESINSDLSYLSANTCNSAEAVVGIQNAQAGKVYKLYKGETLVESVTANTSGELIFANANNELVEGVNTFNIQIEGEGCGVVDVAQNLSITIFESINPNLNINSPDVCSGDQVNIEISNPQAGKTYRLMASESVIATELASNDNVLLFSLPSNQFGIGYHAMTIDIIDDNCGTLTANQTVEFELFDTAVIAEVENLNACKGESVTVDLSANVAMGSYQLYVGEELISEVSNSTVSLSPLETTTYTLTGIPESGCSVNTVNFTIEVTDLATPGILVSANVLESSIEGDSYQWFLNGEVLAGDIGKVLVAQESGDYTVQVGKANCSKISDAYTFSEEVLNANKALADAIDLYPNPVLDALKIDMKNINELEITIYTLSGKFMDKMNINSDKEQLIDMSKFSEGTYLIQLKSGKGSITKRIIKK